YSGGRGNPRRSGGSRQRVRLALRSAYTGPMDDEFTRRTADDWRAVLSPEAFHVLREHGTERAGSSSLNAEKSAGTFCCAGCGQPLFASESKFECGTGWPSFWKLLDGSVQTVEDRSFFMARTEVRCGRC